MKSTNDNPEITPFLRNFTLIETLVLVAAGFGLFLFPDFTRSQWPWQIAPFNARFLGAIYLGAMVSVGYMFISGRWSPTRPVLRAIFTFTFMVLVVSLFTIDQFEQDKTAAVWGWFVLYVSLPLSAGYHLWLYRSMPTSHLNPVLRNWQISINSLGFILGIYGLGLIVFPTTFSSLFPWKLDVFHSQLYSSTFVTGAIMLNTISKRATPAEFIATGLTLSTFGIFSILGLFIVDAEVNKIDWSALNTLSWMIFLAVPAIFGITLIRAGVLKVPHKNS